MRYYTKVWLFTVTVAPLVLVLGLWVINTGSWSVLPETLPLAFLTLLFGLGFSLPSLFVSKFLYRE